MCSKFQCMKYGISLLAYIYLGEQKFKIQFSFQNSHNPITWDMNKGKEERSSQRNVGRRFWVSTKCVATDDHVTSFLRSPPIQLSNLSRLFLYVPEAWASLFITSLQIHQPQQWVLLLIIWHFGASPSNKNSDASFIVHQSLFLYHAHILILTRAASVGQNARCHVHIHFTRHLRNCAHIFPSLPLGLNLHHIIQVDNSYRLS